MKKLSFLFLNFLITGFVHAQIPISLWHKADTSKPLIIYISGDGGMNKFSLSLMESLTTKGFSAIGLNAKDYFWKKKTPQQAAQDVSTIISRYSKEWKLKNVVFIGYSFGADVAPFIYNLLPADVKNKISLLVLLSPSATTDFEIHLSDIFGFSHADGESVVVQVNNILKKVVLFFGTDEKDFPLEKLTVKNKEIILLKGGHHYDGDTNAISKEIISRIK